MSTFEVSIRLSGFGFPAKLIAATAAAGLSILVILDDPDDDSSDANDASGAKANRNSTYV